MQLARMFAIWSRADIRHARERIPLSDWFFIFNTWEGAKAVLVGYFDLQSN